MEGGSRAGDLGKVLLWCNIVGSVAWGGDAVVVGSNSAEFRGSLCGVPETGEKVKGKNSNGRFVVDGGSKTNNSGSGDTTSLNLLGQETGESGGMGGPTSHIQCTCKGDGIGRRGEALGDMVETGGSG